MTIQINIQVWISAWNLVITVSPYDPKGHSDNSGIRFYYTRSERKYKASSISFGHQIGVNMFLPAEQKAIKVSSLCPSDCTKAVTKHLVLTNEAHL